MAEAKGAKSEGGIDESAGGVRSDRAAGPRGRDVRLKNVWPIPALALGAGLLIVGGAVAVMNRPKAPADIPLEQAKALVQEKRYQEAIDKLNSKEVRTFIDFGSPDAEHVRAFHLARARAFAGAQETLGISRAENHRTIVEEYERAEKAGEGTKELEPTDVSVLVGSLVALDDVDRAMGRIGALPEQQHDRRTRLTKLVVEHNLAIAGQEKGEKAEKRADRTLELLAGLTADPALSAAERAWVVARQGEMLLAAGKPEEAINKLIRHVGLIKDLSGEQQGELYVLLGRAYFQADQPLNAAKQLEAADAMLEKASPLRAELGVMQGKLAQSGVPVGGASGAVSENDPTAMLEYAREKFESVLGEFGTSPVAARAVLGLAEVEAALRHDDRALAEYGKLAQWLKEIDRQAESESLKVAPRTGEHGEPANPDGAKGEKNADKNADKKDPAIASAEDRIAAKFRPKTMGGVTRERVLTSLMQRYQERSDAGQDSWESALRYADMAESMYVEQDVPAEVLRAIGETHRRLGDLALGEAKESHAADPLKRGMDFSTEELDTATRAEVHKHYIVAGDYLKRHAYATAATDPAASAASLWTAADSYDRAGDLDEAQKAFADYASSAADTDAHRPEARYRLAQVLQAKTPPEYAAAEALYRALVEERDPKNPARSAGSWSDAAIVPLAHCLLADSDPANDQEAEQLLLSAVDGSRFGPEAGAYRDAKLELGIMYYRAEDFGKAVSYFDQLARLAKDDKRIDNIRYLLADSHRRAGVKIGKALATQRLPQSQLDRLESERVEHLGTARAMFEAVREALASKEARTLTNLDRVHLRNAMFYAGDCSMELKDYPEAIAAYDAARQKYSEDPASLVAMAQIVSAYTAQGKWDEARTANERARQQLARFPESVWQQPDLPMEKRHWEKWLDARTVIEQQRANGQKDE